MHDATIPSTEERRSVMHAPLLPHGAAAAPFRTDPCSHSRAYGGTDGFITLRFRQCGAHFKGFAEMTFRDILLGRRGFFRSSSGSFLCGWLPGRTLRRRFRLGPFRSGRLIRRGFFHGSGLDCRCRLSLGRRRFLLCFRRRLTLLASSQSYHCRKYPQHPDGSDAH